METHFSTNLAAFDAAYLRQRTLKTAEEPERPKIAGARGLPAGESARTEVYTPGGKVTSAAADRGNLLARYQQIRASVKEQLAALSSHINKAPARDNPDAAVGNPYLDLAGPPSKSFADLSIYWNRENTARRIFAIALMGYHEEVDREAFADQAVSLITQAYADVQATMSFDFPQVVLDTKRTVLDALEQFRGGKSIEEISF